MKFYKILDKGSSIVISLTFALFAISLVAKGLTHDLLLEAAIFMISVKLIIMTCKSNIMKESIEAKLDRIHDELLKIDELNSDCDDSQVRRGSGREQIGEVRDRVTAHRH